MTAPVISISSDFSNEVPIVPADPLVAPEVGAVFVISPTGVLDLVDYSSSSDSDPSKDSLPVAPELPFVSPFLCSDDSEADSESEPAEQRPERHESLAPSSEFPLAPVVAPPEIHRRPAILRVGPFPARRLAWRCVSHCSSDRHSLGCDVSGQSHSGPSTKVTSPRSAPLSTPYLPTTSESSLYSSSERLLDSSSPSAGPSRKRCRSPTTLVPSSTPILRSITPALVDLPPRKGFRYSYSSEDSREEHMEIRTADVEVATSDIRKDEEEFEAETSEGGTMEIEVYPLVTGRISEPTGGDAPDLEGTLYDIAHYMSEVPLDKITEFETAQRQLEAGQLVASRERASLADRVRSLGRENLRVRALLCIERDCVDGLRRHMALSQEEFRQIRIRRLNSLVERRLGFHR
ncbi:hypothetical protein Tco_0851354 [Tanacetum coccineum]